MFVVYEGDPEPEFSEIPADRHIKDNQEASNLQEAAQQAQQPHPVR